MYNRYASFWKKSPFVTKRWIPLTFPQRSVKKKKIRENFRFPLWKAARKVGKFQSSGDEDSRERFMKRESRFHTRATNTFTRKTRSLSRRYSTRRARLRFFEGDSTPGRNKRFDLCPLAVSLRDDLWIVARSFHLTSFRVLLCTS